MKYLKFIPVVCQALLIAIVIFVMISAAAFYYTGSCADLKEQMPHFYAPARCIGEK